VTNVDLSTLLGPSEVVTQPELSDGATPIRASEVWLFAQTDPDENGPYNVGADESLGVWTKMAHPNRFWDPAGNWSTVMCNAPGTAAHGVRFVCLDDDRTKSRRAGSSTLSTPSGSETWYRLGPVSSDLTANPVAASTATPTHTYYASGAIYSNPNVTVGGTREVRASRATATPIVIPADVTIDALQVDLSGAVADATPIDLHLFATADGYPTGAPVASASVTTSGTGAQVLLGTTASPVTLDAGAYWAVIHNRAAATNHVTARSIGATQHLEPLPHSGGTNSLSCYLTNNAVVGTTAITAFPVVANTTTQNQGPMVQYRVD
jgi:hypothetical protein